MYLDSAYIAKYYVNEPDAAAVRKLIRSATEIYSSAWALAEVVCAFHRHVREGSLTPHQGHEFVDLFRDHVDSGFWSLVPVTNMVLRTTATLVRSLPPEIPLRAGDAVHLVSALQVGESQIWTSDRHLLGAATHFGIEGRRV